MESLQLEGEKNTHRETSHTEKMMCLENGSFVTRVKHTENRPTPQMKWTTAYNLMYVLRL